jgi:phage terminase large subunit GpA-like protein
MSRAWCDGLRPAPMLTPAEWADQHRVLSSRASSEPGPWRTDRTPYLREPLECLGVHHETNTVVMMFGAQTGKSECGNNWTGYLIHSEPGPLLMVQPTAEMAARYSRQRLAPLIAESAVLRALVAAPRGRDESNTLTVKEFPGGVLLLAGANSAAGLRSMPIRYVFADEVDAWPATLPGEGDPLGLALKRQSTFPNRKTLITSTPTIKGQSRVERLYLESDRRQYFVPCPHCGELQVLNWPNLRWDEGDPSSARYVCSICGADIDEHHKATMLSAGEWRASAPFRGVAGFHLSTLYSPLGWTSWADLADEHQGAYTQMKMGDSSTMQVFKNTRLAETWEPVASKTIETHDLQRHCGTYRYGNVPNACVVLTAGVDVQDDRLEISVHAHDGEGRVCLVAHERIEGYPGDPPTWAALDELLGRQWPSADGRTYAVISYACVDSGGHHTESVYRFCAHGRRVAVKGASWELAGILGPVKRIEYGARGASPRGYKMRLVNVNRLKNLIAEKLALEPGVPGALAFPADILECVPDYFEQLTAERMIEDAKGGSTRYRWTRRSGVRNEAFDCAVYSLAAGHVLQLHHLPPARWAEIAAHQAKQILAGGNAAKAERVAPERPSELTSPPSARRRIGTIGGLVSRW